MKKTLLSLVAISTLSLASAPVDEKLSADIAAAKAEKEAAEAKLSALEAKLPQNQDIMTHVKFGYIQTDGNTETTAFSVDGNIKKAWDKNSLKLIFDAQYGKADEVVNKKKYFTELQYAYLFSSTLSFTYMAGYKYDFFSSYDYQAYTGPGLKWATYSSDTQKLDLEGSILYSQDKFQNVTPPADETNNYSSYLAKLAYELEIIDDLKFNQDLSYRSAFEDANNYFVFSESKLSSKISDIFSAGVSYKVDFTNEVAPGIEQRDNTLSAFLSIDY